MAEKVNTVSLSASQAKKLLKQLGRIEAIAQMLQKEVTETKKELEHVYAPAPQKGRGMSEKRKAEIRQMIYKNNAHK